MTELDRLAVPETALADAIAVFVNRLEWSIYDLDDAERASVLQKLWLLVDNADWTSEPVEIVVERSSLKAAGDELAELGYHDGAKAAEAILLATHEDAVTLLLRG